MFDNQVGYQLKRVSHALRLAMDEALHDLALTTPQYAALSVLEAQPGSSSAALARHCFVTPQTMNEIAGLLAAVGFIERRSHAENRRIVQLFLTERGTLALAQAHARIFAQSKSACSPTCQRPSGSILLMRWQPVCNPLTDTRAYKA